MKLTLTFFCLIIFSQVFGQTKKIRTTDYSNKQNYTDDKGFKQGRWGTKNKNNEQVIYNYRNDTLNGFYSKGTESWRNEGFYRNGVLDSIQETFEGKMLQHQSYYVKGKPIWGSCFSANMQFLVPIKPFQILDDTTVYIKTTYPSGKLWYEGNFISTKTFKTKKLNHYTTYTIGIHKIYFESGKLKGIVDYDKKTIIEFDSTGQQLYNTKLSDYEVHKQSIETIYIE